MRIKSPRYSQLGVLWERCPELVSTLTVGKQKVSWANLSFSSSCCTSAINIQFLSPLSDKLHRHKEKQIFLGVPLMSLEGQVLLLLHAHFQGKLKAPASSRQSVHLHPPLLKANISWI